MWDGCLVGCRRRVPPLSAPAGKPNNALWAPFVLKVASEYRLYYSLACDIGRLSVIGLAVADSPEGPWTEKGIVVASLADSSRQTNAIDPTVVVTPGGDQWMYYGSAWDGIYVLHLDPATGLALNSGDRGRRIANRGFTGGKYNGNIEGAEVVYNSGLQKYFLFIAYDWLETKYNTRVMRGDAPDGPFYDFDGADANTDADHGPMIVAPYQFSGHGGWQGVSHCSVFQDDGGQYYIANQGRPGVNKYFMDLQVRKLFWTADGWPVASPERYAWEGGDTVPRDSLIGNWEQINLGYRVVPGYQAEQVSPDIQVAVPLVVSADGTLNNDAGSKWSYTGDGCSLTGAMVLRIRCMYSGGGTGRISGMGMCLRV
ncbi:family 43 glycosylhydrolase [Puia sp. P3]|uniref:family 43 glycosylhydrolase n=1 Tax=Puia sp. P3 TaxID=3423952 RepID=UPI003D66BB43